MPTAPRPPTPESASPADAPPTRSSLIRPGRDADQALYRAIAQGDRTAFDSAHARLGPWIRRFFLDRTQSNQSLADDLTQRTWTGVWAAVQARRYDPARSAFPTFLYAVAQNIWRQHLRRALDARTPSALSDGERLPAPEHDPADSASLAELVDAVRAALQGNVPDFSHDDVLLLGLISRGLSDRELASTLGVAPSTAHLRKRACLEKLRTHLQGKSAPRDQSP